MTEGQKAYARYQWLAQNARAVALGKTGDGAHLWFALSAAAITISVRGESCIAHGESRVVAHARPWSL